MHDLTGLYSVYTNWRSIEIMFHVSTQLPYEKNDPQKVSGEWGPLCGRSVRNRFL